MANASPVAAIRGELDPKEIKPTKVDFAHSVKMLDSRMKGEKDMPILDKHDDKIIRLVTQAAQRFDAKVKQIDLKSQTLDIDCPEENKAECAVAIQKILQQHQGS
ncbi:MAG: hypothetical protein AMK69_00165 [Nitrospira bacterium SG8_3]|nr:MAG: hypothetical protein AMK69_00165 [Nitrospira bacterium SG8_3]